MQELMWVVPAEHKIRTTDWFWAIGLITLVGAGTAFFVGNSLFGIFILIAGSLLFYSNLQKPNDTTVHINEKEITVNGLSYISKKMRGFAIVKTHDDSELLIVRTDRFFMPTLLLKIPDEINIHTLEEILTKRIVKEDLHEPQAHALADKLGL